MSKTPDYTVAPRPKVVIRLTAGSSSATIDSSRFKTVQAIIDQFHAIDSRSALLTTVEVVQKKGPKNTRSITNPQIKTVWNYLCGSIDEDAFFAPGCPTNPVVYWQSIHRSDVTHKLGAGGSEMGAVISSWSRYYQFAAGPHIALSQYAAQPASDDLTSSKALQQAAEYFRTVTGEHLIRPSGEHSVSHADWVLYDLIRERIAILITQEAPVKPADVYDSAIKDFLTVCARSNIEPALYCFPAFSQLIDITARAINLFVDISFVELYAKVYEPITFSVRDGE